MCKSLCFNQFYDIICNSKITEYKSKKWYRVTLHKYTSYADFTTDLDKYFNKFIDEIIADNRSVNLKAKLKKLISLKKQIESLNGVFVSQNKKKETFNSENFCELTPSQLLSHNIFVLNKINDAIKFLEDTITELEPKKQFQRTRYKKLESRIGHYLDKFKNNKNFKEQINYLEEQKRSLIKELKYQELDYYDSPYCGFIECEIDRLKDNLIVDEEDFSSKLFWKGNKRDLFELIFALSKTKNIGNEENDLLPRNDLFQKISSFFNVGCPKNISNEINKILNREIPNNFINELNTIIVKENTEYLEHN